MTESRGIPWPKIIVTDDLPPNPDPDHLPEEVYRAFAGLTLPVVTPLGDYGYWCPFVSEAEQDQAEGVMCSAEMLMMTLREKRPEAAGWFEENVPLIASGNCQVDGEERAYMIVFPPAVRVPHSKAIAHDHAIHTRDRLPA